MKTLDELVEEAYVKDMASIETRIREGVRQGDTSTRVFASSLYVYRMMEELKSVNLDAVYDPIRKIMTITWGQKL